MRLLPNSGTSIRAAACLAVSVFVLVAPTLRAQRVSEGLYSLIRDDNRAFFLADAKKKLAAGDYLAAIETLREVLRCSPSAVMQVRADRWVGLREAARLELEQLDSEARRIYERTVSAEAAPRLAELIQRRAAEEVSRVALRYPASSSALEARLLAGDLFLEEGRSLRALREYDLVARQRVTPELAARRFLGRALEGLPRTERTLAGIDKLPLGARQLERDVWLREIAAFVGDTSQLPWAAYGGGLSNERRPENPGDVREPSWETAIEHLDQDRYPLNLFPTSDGRRTFVNTGTSLYALDLLRGADGAWVAPGHIGSIRSRHEQEQYLISLNRDFAHSSALGQGLVIAPLQVPIIPDIAKENHSFNHIPIMRRLPVRRLHAYEADTGRLVWAHYDEGGLPPELRGLPLDVSAPPLIVDDTVYVLTHNQIGTIALYVCAFDIHSGALRWKTLVCSSQTEVNMFGNRSNEFAGAPLAYDSGVIFGATNLGLCFAARADDGSMRWMQEYPIISIPRSRMRPRLRDSQWANNPPVIADGKVVLTPTDSHDALCLDVETGAVSWRLPYEVIDRAKREVYRMRWLLGVIDGQAWFSGQAIVRVDLKTGLVRLVASPEKLGMGPPFDDSGSIPRGLLTNDRLYYLSATGGLVVLDHDGQVRMDVNTRTHHVEIGNMLSKSGVLVTARPQAVHAYYSIDELLARARSAAEADPTDPALALAYAELLGASPRPTAQQLEAAARRFRGVLDRIEAKEMGPASAIALRAKSGLYRKLRSLSKARQDLGRIDQARALQSEALALARELWRADALDESELIQYSVELLGSSATDAPMTARILDALEREHGRSEFEIGDDTKVKVGLFVLARRYTDLEVTAADEPAERLAILRRILVEYGDALLPGTADGSVTGRSFAMRNIAALVDRHGKAIYAPYEDQARTLVEAAGGDRGKLQVVLEQYPTSESASLALVRLAVLAAERGDLPAALDAFRFGRVRMTTTPTDMLASLSTAAARVGNRALAAAFEAMRAGTLATTVSEPLAERIESEVVLQLQHMPRLSTRVWPRSLRSLQARRMAGFATAADFELPLLLLSDNTLVAFAAKKTARRAGSEDPRIQDEDPSWSIPFDEPLRDLRPAICGEVLVLPEESRVRGIALRDGRTLWTRAASDLIGGANKGFVLGQALSNGLFGLFLGSLDFSRPVDFEFVGIEPLSGGVCFVRAVKSARVPPMRGGYAFRFYRPPSEAVRLQILSPLRGRREEIVFDGRDGPLVNSQASRHVQVTNREIFVFVPFDYATEEGAAGLYCWERTPTGLTKKWFLAAPDALESDTFLIRGPEVLLSQGFHLPPAASLLRIDRQTGQVRRKIPCGYGAVFATLPSGTDPDGPEAGPVVILGEDNQQRARLTFIDTRPGGEAWAVELSSAILRLPLPEDFPPPLFGRGEVVLTIPRVRGSSNRDFRIERFSQRDGRRLDSSIGRKPWREVAEVRVWNGSLLVRTRDNAWLFGAKMEAERRSGSIRENDPNDPNDKKRSEGKK